MRRSTRLSSAVFQLTPTRTRFDLLIIAYEKKEKIASGLLEPYLAHLKTAQDQIAKGGYSILLEPETESDAAWFTKATIERFVRFVSTPEVLERVYTLETEILQIEKAIAVQNSYVIGRSIQVEDHQEKFTSGYEGNRSVPLADEEKAIVLYKPDANGSCSQERNSKDQLLKVHETRKAVLQREQGMAFARAVAADFEIDQMAALVSFAECFGAIRLLEACSRFIELWNSKKESGQWSIKKSEEFSTRIDFLSMNSSGINLSATPNKHHESANELSSENNLISGPTSISDNPVPNTHEGNFPHLMFSPWAMHAPPGTHPVFPPYPVQGVPYYQAYTGDGPVLETWEIDRTRSLDDLDAEVSDSGKPRKRSGGSKKKKSGMIVIRNINYINSKEEKSGSESISDSDSDIDTEDESFVAHGHDMIQHNGNRSYNIDRVSNFEKDTDAGHWQAFQTCLLRGNYEDANADNKGMFAMGNDVKRKTYVNSMYDDPLAVHGLDTRVMQDTRTSDIHRMNGRTSLRLRESGDDALLSRSDNEFSGTNNQTDIQFTETDGRNMLSSTTNEDYMLASQHHHTSFRNATDILAVNGFNGTTTKNDGEFIIPFRSMAIDQADRTSIYLDSEITSANQKFENEDNFEPDALRLIPEWGTEKSSAGYDHALEYEMQVWGGGAIEKGGKDIVGEKGDLRKSNRDGRSKVISGSSIKQVSGGPIKKGNSSKMGPSEDARARAEKIRSYKADLQKIKKEKEQADANRLEALKLDRQKRIAARGSSTATKQGTLSPQTKQLPAKHSPTFNRGSSKFSDSEPGPSSPLQRSKIRVSLVSSELMKSSKVNKISDVSSHMAGNRLTKSAASLSETKRESDDGLTPDSKARIRRLSEPKTNNNPHVISMKARSAEAIQKRKLLEEHGRNKTYAAINLNRSKAATSPESKVITSESPINVGDNEVAIEDRQKVNGMKPSKFCKNAEPSASNCSTKDQIDAEDNPIVEKTVVMLAPVDGVNRNSIPSKVQNHSEANEVQATYSEKEPPHSTTSERPCEATSTRVTFLEDNCTGQSKYCKAPELVSRVEETVKAHVTDVKSLKSDKHPETPRKNLIKESSRGLRRLLKFGKKNPSSSVGQSVDSECQNLHGSEHKNNARRTTLTGEVNTVKNLILQDQTSHAASRHFSLFSTFRRKTNEKKQSS